MAKSGNSSCSNLKNVKSKIKRENVNPVFHVQTKEEESKIITKSIITSVLRTGKLELTSRNLASIPDKVWHIHEAPAPAGLVAVDFDNYPEDTEQWWNHKPLTLLNFSHNAITNIPAELRNFTELTTLLLQHNALTVLPKEIGQLQSLTQVDLSHNQLKVLPNEFYHLTNLTKLNLAHNELENLDVGISDFVMLATLDVSHNQLPTLPDGIGFLVRVEVVNFAHNQLTELPPDIVGMRSAHTIDVSCNALYALPEAMNELGRIASFKAQQNKIKAIPEVSGSINVKELFLANNEITEIPVNFCENFTQLRTLDLRDNKIEKLPDEMAAMNKLVRLDLSNNAINEIPNALSSLPHLTCLQLQGNPIKTIRHDVIQSGSARVLRVLRERQHVAAPEVTQETRIKLPDKYQMKRDKCLKLNDKELTDVPEQLISDAVEVEVTCLDVSNNRLKEFACEFQQLPALHEINLENNQITAIPKFIDTFTRLVYLNVGQNLLDTLPHQLGLLTEVREFNIAFNRFAEIPKCVYQLHKLQILIANDNKIHEIDTAGLANLNRLATLDLTNNEIQNVPPVLGNLKQITSLSITGNPFRYPRHAILEKGTAGIMSYLRDRIPKSD